MSQSVTTCPRCRQPVQPSWRLCPHCGQSLADGVTTTPADPPVVRLACPSCGGMLPLPTTSEYLTCPYCRTPLQLRANGSTWSLVLAQQIGKAVGQEVRQALRAESQTRSQDQANRRYRRRQIAGANEVLGMFVGCVGAYGLLMGLLPAVAQSGLGYILLAGAGVAAVLSVIFDLRLGYTPARSLLRLGFIAIVVLGLMVGLFWYLGNLAHQPFTFGAIPTPSPRVP